MATTWVRECTQNLTECCEIVPGDPWLPVCVIDFFPLANPEEFDDDKDQFSFKKMLPRDERRFKSADLDGDLVAGRDEFTAFLHPEEFEHMKEIVVLVSQGA